MRDRYMDSMPRLRREVPMLRKILRRDSYDDIDDLEQLREMEYALEEAEDDLDPYQMRRIKVRLYRRMWEVDPGEDKTRYERSIAKLLLELGTDAKLNRLQLDEARRYFQDLIRLKAPAPVPIAHYRLGFIAYARKKWDQVIRHLDLALDDMRRKDSRIESWARLSRSQKLRAHVALALACEHKRKESARQAKNLFGDGTGLVEDDRYWLSQLSEMEEEEAYYMCVDGQNRHDRMRRIGEREFRRLKQREDVIVLDCTETGQGRLWFQGVDCRISGRNLDLLKCLAGSPSPVTNRELEGRLGTRNPAVYVWRLRQFLEEQLGLPGAGLIERVRPNRLNRRLSDIPDGRDDGVEHAAGYRWTHPNTFIVYREDDPEYIFDPI